LDAGTRIEQGKIKWTDAMRGEPGKNPVPLLSNTKIDAFIRYF
jgi:hypothetical protein